MKKPALPLEEAQARLLALATPLPVEHVDIAGTLGHYLAQPLHARRTQPPADMSAMDGYAMLGDDTAGPWRVIGESAAGHPYDGRIAPGEAVRISTGAVVPADADAVILQEDLARDGDVLTLTGDAPHPAGKHIRRRGMDFTDDAQVLPAGVRIGPAQIGLAIAAGHGHLPVRRKPRLTIIDSGDELALDYANCAPHQIPASNGAVLQALTASLPCTAQRLGPVADDMDALAGVLAQADNADVVVTSGGVSVGDHDLMRPALEAWGADIDFWRVAIKPGKPLLIATRERAQGRQLIIGLPGNPVSSYVTAYLFLLPVLRAMLGAGEPLPRRIAAKLAAPLAKGGSRREFVRASWDGMGMTPQTLQDSGALSALAASNALIDRAAGADPAAAGDMVTAYLLESSGGA